MIFIVKGRVKVSQDGDEICTYAQGSWLGDVDCFFTPLRIASCRAITACELYVLPRETLHQACSEWPTFGIFLRRIAVKRLRKYGEVLGEPLVGDDFLAAVEKELRESEQLASSVPLLHQHRRGGGTFHSGSASRFGWTPRRDHTTGNRGWCCVG